MKLLTFILLIFCFSALAHTPEFNKPNLVLVDENKEPIEGVTSSTNFVYCLQKATGQPAGTYYCVQPDIEVIVPEDEQTEPDPDPAPEPEPDPEPAPDPEPEPDPEPIPDPEPDPVPPTAATCEANAAPWNYVNIVAAASSGSLICLEDGLYTNGLTVPSGVTVQAANRNKAEFKGGDSGWTGILVMNGVGATVDGLKFHHASYGSHACVVTGSNNTMKNTTCSHGGSYKHSIPLMIGGVGNLIEDSWFYGEGRYVVQCYGGKDIIIRRNVARWDSTAPNEAYEPNATFSIYACSDVLVENNISLDYGKPATRMDFGGDFYMPAHSGVGLVPNNNKFLGNFAINHAVDTDNRRAIRLDPDMTVTGVVVNDFIVRGSDEAFVFSSSSSSTTVGKCKLTDVVTAGASCTGLALIPDIFPLANEALIKANMCATEERQSTWCTTDLSLSDYIIGTEAP